MQTTRRNVTRVITKMQQRVQRRIGNENYIAATTTIATGWTTTRDKLLTPESRNTVTSVTPLNVNLGAIYKHLTTKKLKATHKKLSDAAQLKLLRRRKLPNQLF
jgi:hypothetical protein